MKKIALFLVVVFIVAIALTQWWKNGIAPANASNTSVQKVVISQNSTTAQIAALLKSKGLISNSLVFLLLAKKDGFDGKLQSGDFDLSASMNARDILNTLSHGSVNVWVTIPEGLRATEIAAILAQKVPSYSPSWGSRLIANEGYLFPDTYLFPKNVTIEQIIQTMRDNFAKKYQEAASTQTNNLTQSQAVTLASIIEREAISADDKRKVASVLENRLSIGMALGSDVTVEYALGYQPDTKTWWKKDLTADDLLVQSSYNTRINAGLPPTPISNPGLTSLEAALNPAKTNYMYYVSDKNGVLHFAATLDQHNANVQKYGM